ncbi:ABC transporter permease [Hymenobacter properus]|uniref:ABC transporter permease n=1 Tax=Hymenobacter properus TaxID=2791026 RepID=A0A931BL53_9BACT|nr:ABC transporter permease [Hymenobacter properus]MBF9143411.1 ABC transporter permease [Hymenobacter properus]MBR7722224.1 ABC transporter permease [Microvirga sp. SRT04]
MASKFLLVAQREYLTRVRKKAFIVLTLAVPLLLAGFGVFVAKIASSDNDTTDVVEVRDDSGLNVASRLVSTPQLRFETAAGTLAEAKKGFQKAKHDGLVYLPAGLDVEKPTGVQFFGKGNISLKKQLAVENALNKAFSELKMQKSGLSQEQLDRLRSKVDLQAISLDETGKEANSNALATSGMSYALALAIYLFIFIYGVQIMRGVGEEKSSRIMEVMLSSVKPFDLMMGKIMGIAAVGLTQFLMWGLLSFGASSVLLPLVTKDDQPKTEVAATPASASGAAAASDDEPRSAAATFDKNMQQGTKQANPASRLNIFETLANLPLGTILFGFIVYFLGGYLLYGALFGAVGAAVDDQTDTQQFMMPITMPLILSYIVGVSVILRNPDGPVAFWMSMIPFTSPIAMVIRLPFGVPAWQLALSIFLLILGFIGTVWVAARIYRVGILMYGKKVTYKELGKWMFYKG